MVEEGEPGEDASESEEKSGKWVAGDEEPSECEWPEEAAEKDEEWEQQFKQNEDGKEEESGKVTGLGKDVGGWKTIWRHSSSGLLPRNILNSSHNLGE